MTVGNLAAITQTNVKVCWLTVPYACRLHSAGPVAGNSTGMEGVAVYLLVYTFMNLGAFLVVCRCGARPGRDIVDDFAGLMHRSPATPC
jgi:NADH-quinone oxidoreductase subunit N